MAGYVGGLLPVGSSAAEGVELRTESSGDGFISGVEAVSLNGNSHNGATDSAIQADGFDDVYEAYQAYQAQK